MTKLQLIQLEADGTVRWIAPDYLPEDVEETIKFAIDVFHFLLNTSEKRGRWHTFTEFADMIEASFHPSPKRDEVLRVLRM